MKLIETVDRLDSLEAQELGLKYFLEVSIAREILEGWVGNLNRPVTVEERCSRLINYAMYDA